MKRQIRGSVVLALIAALLIACAPAQAPQPQEAPAEAPAAPAAEEPAPAEAPAALRRVAVIHDDWVGLYTVDGIPLNNITTAGRAEITTLGERFLVTDREQTRIFDFEGQQIGPNIVSQGSAGLAASPERVVLSYGGWAALLDGEGQPIANLRTVGLTEPFLSDDRLVLAGEDAIYLADSDGVPIANLPRLGGSEVELLGGSLVERSANDLRVYGLEDGSLRLDVPLSNGSVVAFGDEHVAVAHDGWVELRSLDGEEAVNVETVGLARIAFADGLLTIADDESVRVYTPDGELKTQSMAGSPQAEVMVDGDRILVCQEGWLGLYDGAGNPLANLQCSGRPEVRFVGGRIVVADDNLVRIYDRNGSPQGQTAQGAGGLATGDEAARLVVIRAGWADIVDLEGLPVHSLPLVGEASVRVDRDGLLVIDGSGVRAYTLDGMPAGQPIPADSRSEVQVLP